MKAPIPNLAPEMISDLKQNLVTNDYTISQMALFQKEGSGLKLKDACDSGIKTTDDTSMGGLIGLLIGIWTGPLGMLLCGSSGALIGSIKDTGDASQGLSMLELVGEKLSDQDTALILLADEADESSLDEKLRKFEVEIMRREAAEVSQEVDDARVLEKELAKEARKKTRENKRNERKADLEARRAKIKSDFAAWKEKLGL